MFLRTFDRPFQGGGGLGTALVINDASVPDPHRHIP